MAASGYFLGNWVAIYADRRERASMLAAYLDLVARAEARADTLAKVVDRLTGPPEPRD